MSPRTASRAPSGAAAPTPLALPDLETLLADDPAARAALAALIAPALARGVERVHVELAAEGWRLRQRHGESLLEERLDGDGVPDALARMADALGTTRAFTVRLGGERRLATLHAAPGTPTRGYLLTLGGNALAPPRLDALGLDPRGLLDARTLLESAAGGWLTVTAASELAGAALVRALAQELVAPERKILCLEPHPCPPLAGVLQLDAGAVDAAAALLELDADAVLLVATPPDEVLRALAARAAEGLLVVQRCGARRASGALRRLLAPGLTPSWAATTLLGSIASHRVRLLCPHCRTSAATDCEDAHRLDALRAPRVTDVAAWLERSLATRARRGAGCSRCHASGYAGLRDLVDVVPLDAAVRAALLRGDIDAAREGIDVPMTLAARLDALHADGEIDAGEALGHLRPSY